MSPAPEAFLELKEIRKVFGSNVANDSVSLSVQAGTIHALVGENGAGKSTLMKILFGIEAADSGEIWLGGKRKNFKNAIEAKNAGLGMVHQHFMLADPIRAIDHIFLEEKTDLKLWQKIFLPLSRKKKIQELAAFSESLGFSIPWEKPVADLSVGLQQRLEILKILYNQSSLLILDEPTAVLAPQEVEQFFGQLRKLKEQGKTIVIITHKLKEVLKISDAVTVLRHGKTIATVKTSETSSDQLAELMMGRKPRKLASTSLTLNAQASPLLSVQNLTGLGLKNLTLQVRPGEIVGIAGIEGNGQSELLKVLNSPDHFQHQMAQGEIEIFGTSAWSTSTKSLRRSGVRFLGEDRIRQSLLPQDSLRENFYLGFQSFSELQKSGWVNQKSLHEHTEAVLNKMDVRPRLPQLKAGSFSGGNQQKFVVGRELSFEPKLLIVAHPSRGVDIGAIETIHSELSNLRKTGAGVLLVSSEIDELFALSDRLLVFNRGQIVQEFLPKDYDEKTVGLWMTGGPA